MLLTVFLCAAIAALIGWAGGVRGGSFGAAGALKELRREFAELDADLGALQQQVQRLNGRKGREVRQENAAQPDVTQLLMQMLLAQKGKSEGESDEGFVGTWDGFLNRQKAG